MLTPAVRGSVASPTGGWNVGGSYLVDVVTAASPDVVSTASRRFADARNAATLTGGYQPGRFGAQAFGSVSSESDYVSRTLGLAVSGDFLEKQLTPQIGFAHTWDTISRAGTPYDVVGVDLMRDGTDGAKAASVLTTLSERIARDAGPPSTVQGTLRRRPIWAGI